jgi:hypothetical protein
MGSTLSALVPLGRTAFRHAHRAVGHTAAWASAALPKGDASGPLNGIQEVDGSTALCALAEVIGSKGPSVG